MQRVDRSARDSEKEFDYIAQRLRDRRSEIAAAVLSRINAVSPPPEFVDEEYTQGLEAAVGVAIEYGLGAVELGGERSPTIPPALLIQARLAALHRVSLESVLRRYLAGHALMAKFVTDEVRRDPALAPGAAMAVAQLSASLERLVDAVSEEHGRGAQAQIRSTDQHLVDLVRRLLHGETLSTDRFAYDFGARHVGIVASGIGAADSARAVAKALDRRLLLVAPTETRAWAWLEVRAEFDWREFERAAGRESAPPVAFAVGDLGEGNTGWRRTHEQAQAASALTARRPGAVIRYGPNSLRLAALRDDLLKASLEETYLVPLSRGGRADSVLQDTLRCYLAKDRNASAAASALGMSRRTVTNRVLLAEKLLDSSLTACSSALEVALWLEEIEREPSSESGASPGPEN